MNPLNEKMKILLTNLAPLLYLYLIFVSSHTFNLSGIIKGFLAAPLFFIIPVLLGGSIHNAINKNILESFKCESATYYIFLFLWGIVAMTLIYLFMDAFAIFSIELYSYIILIVSCGYLFRRGKHITKKYEQSIQLKYLLIITTMTIAPAIYVTKYSPYPLIVTSDVFNHLHFALILLDHDPILYMEPYLPTFHVLIATSLYVANVQESFLSMFWAMRFLTYPLYGIGIYLYSNKLTGNKYISILSAFVGSWIFIQFGGDQGLYNFTPRIIMYLSVPYLLFIANSLFIQNLHDISKKEFRDITLSLLILALTSSLIFGINTLSTKLHSYILIPIFFLIIIFYYSITALNKKNNTRIILLFSALIPIIFIHNYMGFVLIGLIIGYIFFLLTQSKILSKKLHILIPIIIFLFFLLQKQEILTFNTINFLGTQMQQGFLYKSAILISTYPQILTTLFLVGIVLSIYYKELLSPMLFSSSILFLLTLPIADIQRIILYTPLLIGIFVSYSTYVLINMFKNNRVYSTVLILIFVVIITCAQYNIYSDSIKKYTDLEDADGYSSFTYDEYNAAIWIRQNTAKDTLLISDRFNQYMMGGLSNRDIIIGHDKSRRFETIDIIGYILSEENSTNAYNKINLILNDRNFTSYDNYYRETALIQKHEKAIIVISGRTSNFVNVYSEHGPENAMFASGLPRKFIEFDGFRKFYDKQHFRLIYEVPNKIYIFETI